MKTELKVRVNGLGERETPQPLASSEDPIEEIVSQNVINAFETITKFRGDVRLAKLEIIAHYDPI
jgi:hypothetical protein